jgi:ATP-dependent protease HslVU (ClpYQ) ATPase subunit
MCSTYIISAPIILDLRLTYTGHAGQNLDKVVRQLGTEALELSKTVDVLRVLVQELEDVLEKVAESVVLHLQNPFSGNCVALTGENDRSASLDRGRGKSERQSREQEFETHDEEVGWIL